MMFVRSLSVAALAMTVSTAYAGSPCCCAAPCAVPAPAPVTVYQPYEMPQIYVVDQGPVYSGPGIYTRPTVVYPRPMPNYPHYPYGGIQYQGSPYVGYDHHLPPYQEPTPLRARAQALPPRRAIRRWQNGR